MFAKYKLHENSIFLSRHRIITTLVLLLIFQITVANIFFAASPAKDNANIEGHWASAEVGSIDFKQKGSVITGTWTMGTISGTITGNHCIFSYKDTSDKKTTAKSTGSLDVIQNGMEIKGVWHYIDGKEKENGSFTAIRVINRTDPIFAEQDKLAKQLDAITVDDNNEGSLNPNPNSSLNSSTNSSSNTSSNSSSNSSLNSSSNTNSNSSLDLGADWEQKIRGSFFNTKMQEILKTVPDKKIAGLVNQIIEVQAFEKIPDNSITQSLIKSFLNLATSFESSGKGLSTDKTTKSAGEALIQQAMNIRKMTDNMFAASSWADVKIQGKILKMPNISYNFLMNTLRNNISTAGKMNSTFKSLENYDSIIGRYISKLKSLKFDSTQKTESLTRTRLVNELKATEKTVDSKMNNYNKQLESINKMFQMCTDLTKVFNQTEMNIIRNLRG